MFDVLNLPIKLLLIAMTSLLSWFIYEPIGLLVVYFNAQLLLIRHHYKFHDFELKHTKQIMKGTQNIWYTSLFSLFTVSPMIQIFDDHSLTLVIFFSIIITYISMLLITDIRIRHERTIMD